jgi:hypothetical protein
MGFWSGLGKIVSPIAKIGGYVAAPFTGGASIGVGNAIGGALDAVGSGAGNASQAAASNRGTKAQLMMDQNRDLESQLLARAQEQRAARSQAYKAAMMGEYANSFKPSARPPGISGSYEGLTDASRGVGSELYKQAMMRLQSPDLASSGANQGLPAYNNLMQNKEFLKTMKPGFWEKFGGIVGAAAPVAGAVLGSREPQSTPGITTRDPNYN